MKVKIQILHTKLMASMTNIMGEFTLYHKNQQSIFNLRSFDTQVTESGKTHIQEKEAFICFFQILL